MNGVLAESLPLARRWSLEGCWHDPADGESCGWYHGNWQTLRLIGVVSTLTHHAGLYIEALRPLIATGKFKRVFLSGSADYGLLAVILDAFSGTEVEPKVTVVDRCSTPLRLCRWYAERFGCSVETVQSDLAAFRSDEAYDLICVHSLLSCVPVEFHEKIVSTWYSLLRPGGVLMMANTIYPAITGKRTHFTPEDILFYRQKVASAAPQCSHPAALPSADELDQMAESFASRMVASVISSREQLTGLLEAGGFELTETRFGKLIADPKHLRTGPPGIKKKEHAWIVARRS